MDQNRRLRMLQEEGAVKTIEDGYRVVGTRRRPNKRVKPGQHRRPRHEMKRKDRFAKATVAARRGIIGSQNNTVDGTAARYLAPKKTKAKGRRRYGQVPELRPTIDGRLLPGTTGKQRLKILKRDKWTCAYCGTADGPFQVDHVWPIWLGGESVPTNLVTACTRCNQSKKASTDNEWFLKLSKHRIPGVRRNAVQALKRKAPENQ